MNSIQKRNLEAGKKVIYLPDLSNLKDETTRDYTAENLDCIKALYKDAKPTKEGVAVKKKRKTYPQDWCNYNLYQTREKAMAYKLLNDAIDSLDIPGSEGNGRPTVDLKEILKCICVKVYNDCSARRIQSELILFRGLGYIKNLYHFNTLCKYLSLPVVRPYLEQLSKLLAEPMIDIEGFFAIDSTGFSTLDKVRWSKVRLNFKAHKDYKKLHITTGVKSHVIASVEISEGNAGDSPYFKPLLSDTAKMFSVREVSADSAYLSRENCNTAKDLGIKPFIMPRKNITGSAKGSLAWKKMIKMWKENEPLFRAHYHRRSNVESTFGMIKRKFGDCLKGKLDSTKENEIMCKVVCHNLTVLVEAMLQFGVKPRF